MTLPEAKKRINERIKPSLFNWGFLALNAILKDLKLFSNLAKGNNIKNILDLGCGVKPYESLFSFADKFIGIDVMDDQGVDDVGYNWDLPYEDDEFDALISTQVLEHTARIPETVQEIRRVVKNGGLVFVSVPFVFPIHGAPYDYYRFTKYGLEEIFKDFKVVKIIPSCGYVATQLRVVNIFLGYIPFSKYLLAPLFFINNSLAIFIDFAFKYFLKLFGNKGQQIYDNVYMSMPENYSVILKNSK